MLSLKLGYYEKATKFEKNLPPVLTKQLFLLSNIKTSWRFFQIFVAFSEKLDFMSIFLIFFVSIFLASALPRNLRNQHKTPPVVPEKVIETEEPAVEKIPPDTGKGKTDAGKGNTDTGKGNNDTGKENAQVTATVAAPPPAVDNAGDSSTDTDNDDSEIVRKDEAIALAEKEEENLAREIRETESEMPPDDLGQNHFYLKVHAKKMIFKVRGSAKGDFR